ncbi:hypothetical protein OG379_13945 [Streptomyces sp. NBC_01166]|uniref:hypothetical protein n=1 Tax=Streptomyces sp. NBC_01166 TaxID=2903755 RepID=UPI00386B461D|nr:hypothetical protein OG379_13945 [Streptomyces sp. NBC_01166]
MPERERLDRDSWTVRGARARTPPQVSLRRPHAGVSPASRELLTASQVAAFQGTAGNAALQRAMRSGPGAGVPVQRIVEDPQERLDAWIEKTNAHEKNADVGAKARHSSALKAFGREVPGEMIEIGEESQDYKADPQDASGKPPLRGGAFKNLFGKDDGGSFAVMMENYRQSKDTEDPETGEVVPPPAYTASDVFLNQWTAADSVLGTSGGLSGGALNKKVKGALAEEKTASAGIPDKLPDRIYRQNISGEQAKKTLGGILGDKSKVSFPEDSDEYRQMMGTVNGKSTLNTVQTYNKVKGLPPERAYFISGGELTKDAGGNFHISFDVRRRS